MNREIFLSCAIITYNEESQIKECIESVHDLCDEIIVLDSHSTDKTKSIARSFSKVKFSVHDFDGHVQQKNRALDLAKGEWILSIDADERVTPELAKSISEFINTSDSKGAKITRLTHHMGRYISHGGWKNARYRLIRRGQGRWGGENPHDEIFLTDQTSLKGRLEKPLRGNLIHYSFKDLSDQVTTINKFSSIVAFNRHGKNKRFSLLKLLIKPPVKFVEMYIFKFGFLDGIQGFIIAISSSFSAFLKIAKLYELQKTNLNRPSNLRPDYKVQNDTDLRTAKK